MEAGESGAQGHPQLHLEFKNSLRLYETLSELGKSRGREELQNLLGSGS